RAANPPPGASRHRAAAWSGAGDRALPGPRHAPLGGGRPRAPARERDAGTALTRSTRTAEPALELPRAVSRRSPAPALVGAARTAPTITQPSGPSAARPPFTPERQPLARKRN